MLSEKTFSIQVPNICPICCTTLEMSPLFGFYDFEQFCNYMKVPYVVLKCPKCERISFASYEHKALDAPRNELCGIDMIHYKLYPFPNPHKEFSVDIEEKYPRFCSIYNEALFAEHSQLKDICGMGYRKALEILIKDYAIEKNPDKESDIKQSALGQCISKYIKSDKIQALSKASAWLGNDETHYERRHTGHSIEEMKLFINAVVSTIETDIAYEKATAFLSGT